MIDPNQELFNRLSVALIRPAFAGNVGAVARVMANFNVRHGVLVAPRCDINSVECRQFATGPSAVTLATMSTSRRLNDCTDGFGSVVAVTRRTGLLRKPSVNLNDLCLRLQSESVMLVFGPEESGLSDEDLKGCTDIFTIPVAESMASLNLSHAVAVVLSGLFEKIATVDRPVKIMENMVTAPEQLRLIEKLELKLANLEAAGQIVNAARYARILSQTLSRAHLDGTEISAWHTLISLL